MQIVILASTISAYLFVLTKTFSFWFQRIKFEKEYFWKLNQKEVVSYSSISKVVLEKENIWTDFRRINYLQEFRIDFFGKNDDLIYSVNLFQEGEDIKEFLREIFSEYNIEFQVPKNRAKPKIHWEYIRIQYLLIICLTGLYVFSLS